MQSFTTNKAHTSLTYQNKRHPCSSYHPPRSKLPAALEKEVERLKESTATLTQRLLDATAKAERAEEEERDAAMAKAVAEREEIEAAMAAAREEETARCRQEFYSALAEVGGVAASVSRPTT